MSSKMSVQNGAAPAEATMAPASDRGFDKALRRLIPFLCLLYFVSFLDRVNVGFAALTMNEDIGLSAAAYGFGAGIFFLGYFLFEVPSNIILQRVGARRWIARIMISWGIVSAATAFATGPVSYAIIRFLLGAAEAGFFPGIILYLTYWFPSAIRGRIMGWFLMALPLSSLIGAPVSTWLLGQQIAGLAGWQTMFLVEAIPAILLGFVVWRLLPDRPSEARWLSPDEAAAMEAVVSREEAAAHHHKLGDAFRSRAVWHFALIYFGIVTGLYGFGFWAPQIMKAMGDVTNQEAGLLTMVPYILAAAALYLWGRHSDRTGERHWHLILPILVGALGFGLAALIDDMWQRLAFLSLAAVGVFAALPIFWTRPTVMLGGAAAAAGIAIINSIGNLGGYVGPYAIGALQASYGYAGGLGVMGAIMLGAMLLAFLLPPAAKAAASSEP